MREAALKYLQVYEQEPQIEDRDYQAGYAALKVLEDLDTAKAGAAVSLPLAER